MKSSTLFTLISGLAAGAALGMIFAPEEGAKTRVKLKKALSEGYDDLKEGLSDFGEGVSDKASEIKESLSSLKDTVLEQGSSFKEEARKKLLEQVVRLEKALSKDEESDIDIA